MYRILTLKRTGELMNVNALDETYIRFHLPLIPKQYSLMYATEPRRACSGTRKALLLVC